MKTSAWMVLVFGIAMAAPSVGVSAQSAQLIRGSSNPNYMIVLCGGGDFMTSGKTVYGVLSSRLLTGFRPNGSSFFVSYIVPNSGVLPTHANVEAAWRLGAGVALMSAADMVAYGEQPSSCKKYPVLSSAPAP